MANFIGGSAFSMANQISEGYLLLNATNLKKLSRGELNQLLFEIQRLMTEVRGNQPPLEDVQAQQQRNRKISRLNSAVLIINTRLTSGK